MDLHSAVCSRCREQNTAHNMGSALVSSPAAAGVGYANDSLLGLAGFEAEPALLPLRRPSGLWDLHRPGVASSGVRLVG
ncbi:unnamed protein product, partial [Iphiclides podalirius]